MQQSIDISCPLGPQQQTRRTLLQRSIDGTERQTDGRTDGRTPNRCIEPVEYYASSVIITRVNTHGENSQTNVQDASIIRTDNDTILPRTVTDKLQRVLNAAVLVITGARKFDRGLAQILHDQLHWLDVPDRDLFKLAVTVHQCLNGRALPYLSEHCIPVSSADTRRHLRSANRHLRYLPYSVSRSTLTAVRRSQLLARWPGTLSLSDFIRDPTSSTGCFTCLLKTYLFVRY